MIQTTTFRSTAISRATFDPEGGQMTVYFQKGGEKTHQGVTPMDFRAFSEAQSAGQHYNERWRNAN